VTGEPSSRQEGLPPGAEHEHETLNKDALPEIDFDDGKFNGFIPQYPVNRTPTRGPNQP